MARHSFNFRPRSILCALDFSAQSATALRHAALIAKRSRGRITVMFVNDPRLLTAEAADNDPRTLVRNTLRELRAFVRRSLPRATSKSIRYVVARGRPAPEILKAAVRLRSELLVVGTGGLGRTRSVFFGSTTEQLLRRAHVPVLAVPKSSRRRGAKTPARDWPGKWLIAPNDLETTAEADAAQAGAVARAFGASVILVHVMPTLHIPSWSQADLGTHYRTAIATAQEWLDELRPALGDGVISKCHVAVGNPADEIAALAEERRIGLVVLTRRRRGRLLGSGLGVIAHHLLSHGVAPVLALPPQGVSVHSRAAA